MIVNPNTKLVIKGSCRTGCDNALSVIYSYQLYTQLDLTTIDLCWQPFIMPSNNSNGLSGMNYMNSHYLYSMLQLIY